VETEECLAGGCDSAGLYLYRLYRAFSEATVPPVFDWQSGRYGPDIGFILSADFACL
jgi:hypothetical protein